MADPVVEALRTCQTFEEFFAACKPLGLYTDQRFMQLELDIINRCNIRCVMCFHSLETTRRAPTLHLSPKTFSAAAARVLPHAYRVSLSLGNEPLMSPHFITMLEILAPYHVPDVNFFTNGLLLTDANIDAMIEYGVTQVCFSIDAATSDTYAVIRRDGDFAQVMRNVERLVERRTARGSRMPRVRFDFVMMQRNVHELVDFVHLAARMGAQDLNFRHMVSFDGLNMEGESLTAVKAYSNYCLDRALAAAATLGLAVQFHPAPFDLLPESAPDAPPARRPQPFAARPYCPYPFFHVSMNAAGEVLPCPFSHGEAPYGRVSPESPLDVIWLGPRFTELRRRILEVDPPEMCRRCSYLGDKYPDVAELFATRRH